MLEVAWNRATDRRLRLVACAAVRRVCRLPGGDQCVWAVEAAERCADGRLSDIERGDAWVAADRTYWRLRAEVAGGLPLPGEVVLAFAYARALLERKGDLLGSAGDVWMFRGYVMPDPDECDTIRDIFGPLPFRPVPLDPSWLTSTVVALARGIYEERAFDRMLYLADALQDGGCENEEVLEHCRAASPHVRGCWVVDLVLGKS
jgi:hypothetical protein